MKAHHVLLAVTIVIAVGAVFVANRPGSPIEETTEARAVERASSFGETQGLDLVAVVANERNLAPFELSVWEGHGGKLAIPLLPDPSLGDGKASTWTLLFRDPDVAGRIFVVAVRSGEHVLAHEWVDQEGLNIQVGRPITTWRLTSAEAADGARDLYPENSAGNVTTSAFVLRQDMGGGPVWVCHFVRGTFKQQTKVHLDAMTGDAL